MKKISFLFGFLLVFSSYTFAQESGNKTLVKTFDPENSVSIEFGFDNKEIKSEVWDAGTMRVELEIHANMPENILAQLVKAGRYSLKGVKDGDFYKIEAANLGKHVSIKGVDLEEEIYVHVKTPYHFEINGNTLQKEMPFAARAGDEEAEKRLKEMSKIKEKIDVEIKFVSTLEPNNISTTKSVITKDMNFKYGDILIDGEPLEME